MSRPRILVVDDEPSMLHGVERCLSPAYEVASARTAVEALERAVDFQPDLLLADIRMPEMDGFELVARLRERQPGVDVIFMTGLVHEFDAQLIRAVREKAFFFIQKPFDREVLLTLVARCLEVRELAARDRRHTERLEAELAEARAFQRSLLPAPAARRGPLRLATRYVPCEALSGDLYDWVDAGRGRTTVLVADVSGHGVCAAMLVGIVKAAFHDAHVDGFAPLAVVQRVASAIRSFEDDRFVTLFCARLDPKQGRLEWVNAGHPAGLLREAGAPLQRLGLTGPLVSPALDDAVWEQGERPLSPGTELLLHTDGVSEARGEQGLFTLARLYGLVDGSPLRGEALLDGILAAVEAFSGGRPSDDDRTLMSVTFAPAR